MLAHPACAVSAALAYCSGLFVSLQELSFSVLWQQALYRPLRVRLSYGPPDVFDKIFYITRGGFARASSHGGGSVSNDIRVGLVAALRGGGEQLGGGHRFGNFAVKSHHQQPREPSSMTACTASMSLAPPCHWRCRLGARGVHARGQGARRGHAAGDGLRGESRQGQH